MAIPAFWYSVPALLRDCESGVYHLFVKEKLLKKNGLVVVSIVGEHKRDYG